MAHFETYRLKGNQTQNLETKMLFLERKKKSSSEKPLTLLNIFYSS